ncbi:MAG: hypothetical protein GXO19_04585 [Epsilonproteobacteria bacterium]|nr:hypothetical protein [Campylobacterota bacterium]
MEEEGFSSMPYDPEAPDFEDHGMEGKMEHASSSAQAMADDHSGEEGHGDFHNLLEELLHDETLPPEVKDVLHDVKKAIKFYDKEDLFEDLNITSLDELVNNPDLLQELEERVKEAEEMRKEELVHALLKDQEKAEYPIKGYFVKIGPGQYDWIYVAANGKVYKLVGVNPETGNFQYSPYDGVVEILDDGKIKVGDEVKKGLPFVKYDDPDEDGFDWVVILNGKPYKLEGFDFDEASFVYTPVDGVVAQEEGDSVELLPGQAG